MKNILYLHASAELYGSDYVLLTLLKNLDREQFCPWVILPFDGPLGEELSKLSIKLTIYDIPVLRRQLLSPRGLVNYSVQFIKSIFFLSQIIRHNNIDIVHTNTSAVLVGGVVARFLGRKHIWQVMELIEKPYPVSFLISWMVGKFSDQVFTISEAVRKHFLKHNQKRKGKFQTLYHGVDLNEYQYCRQARNHIRQKIGIDEETFVIGMAGRINQWKGQDIFIAAVPEILKNTSNKKIHFLILGSCFKGQEHFLTELKKTINQLAIRDHVTLVGFQKNFSDWLSAMDIFVLPSKLPEPNATVTLAAMAVKLPVIGTDTGGTGETIINGQTGFLIEPGNPTMLAKTIIKAINMDRWELQRMGEHGYRRVTEHFSIQHYCETIVHAYTT